MYRLVNIKEGMPNADYAVYLLEKEIDYAKAEGTRVLVFVHGYGSSGHGGAIKEKVDRRLAALKKEKKIVCYVRGDRWAEYSSDVQEIYKYAPELSINNQVSNINSGVTVVLVY